MSEGMSTTVKAAFQSNLKFWFRDTLECFDLRATNLCYTIEFTAFCARNYQFGVFFKVDFSKTQHLKTERFPNI